VNVNLQVVGDRTFDPIIRRTLGAWKSKMSSKDGLFSYQTLVHAVAGAAVSVNVINSFTVLKVILVVTHLAYETFLLSGK